MEAIVREVREKDTILHETYSILLKRVSKECSDAIRESKQWTTFAVPPSMPCRPPYDMGVMTELLKRSLEKCQSFHVVVWEGFLYIRWGEACVTERKKHVYDEITKRAKSAIETYVSSHFYKHQRLKTYVYKIPLYLYGFEKFDPFIACTYIAERLHEDGFHVVSTVDKQYRPLIHISWEHVL